MGWKTSILIIDRLIERKELLIAINREKFAFKEKGAFGDMFPPRKLVIGERNGCTYVADPNLIMKILDNPDGSEAKLLLRTIAKGNILCCELHSVVNLAAFCLFKNGQLVRKFAASGDDGVFANIGNMLEEEITFLSQFSEIHDDDSETIYRDGHGEDFTIDALGEDLVFEVMSTMTCKRIDCDDEIFSQSADVYAKPSLLVSLFSPNKSRHSQP